MLLSTTSRQSCYFILFNLFVLQTTKLECALTISLCLTLVLLIALFTLTVIWRTQRNKVSDGREQMLCEPCSALGINGSPPSGCNKTKEETCCCMASWVIDTLVNHVSSLITEKKGQID